MTEKRVSERCRRALTPVLWFAAATWVLLGLSAGTASAQGNRIEICHKGQIISVDVNAVSAHLEHGDLLGSCDEPAPCGCGLNFDPVTCILPDGSTRTFANECLARCAGFEGCERLGVCSNIFDPVTCGGVIYANRCQALNAGCPPGDIQVLCPCPQIYAPVRCSDGIIYVNSCVAQCRGASGCSPVQ